MKPLINLLDSMKADTVSNYVIAGLDSSIISNGKVRYFENSRDHIDSITPHSHRFDFACLVLSGWVKNQIWEECPDHVGDFFESSELIYKGEIGGYEEKKLGREWWRKTETTYCCGDVYSMTSDQVHSIKFSRGAKVLFFEGQSISDRSVFIQPVVNGETIRTLEVKDYMFKGKK